MSTSPTTDRPFQTAALVCAATAVAGVSWLFLDAAQAHGEAIRIAVLAAATVLALAAAWLHVWPTRARLLSAPLLDLPTALQDARNQLTDLQAVRKEYNKVRTDMEGFAAQTSQALHALTVTLQQGLRSLEVRQQAFDQVVQEIQKAGREMLALRQAKGDAERQAEAWQKAGLQFARYLERTADPESGLAESYLKAAAKLADDFARAYGPLGLQLLRPLPGDLFDDRIHEYAGEIETATVPPGCVARACAWGFLTRDGVTAKARVLLARPVKVEQDPIAVPQPPGLPEAFPLDEIAATALPDEHNEVRPDVGGAARRWDGR